MTFLSGKKVMEYLDLAEEDCIFMMARDYPLMDGAIQSVVFPFSNFPQDTFSAKQWPWQLWEKMKKADTFISELTDQEGFHFYAPQSSTTHFYIIASHPQCEGYSFLEGGVGCYETYHQTNASQKATVLKNLLYAIQYQGRVPVEKFFYNIDLPKYRNAYGSNPAAFAGYPNQVVVGFPFGKKESYQGITDVLVFDALVEFYPVKEQTIEQLLAVVFARLAKENVTTLHFKLHPEHYRAESHRQRYLKMLAPYETKVELIELNKEVKLEEVALSSKATFYTFVSSVGLYASFMGCEVWSLAKLLNDKEPSINHIYKKLGDNPIKYF